ncbi:MAG TPA: glycosyltransferase family 2 protein [Ignavibacteriaceae bacterium]|nr:glycosyltransferase family 2 protein [Ignavibacteriaceae bacterium]
MPIKNELPLVSICIPVFNSEKWIKETVMSAVNQTWTRKEIIVVDDGSSDKTLHILEELSELGIKVYSQSNKGACSARNLAFSKSKGDFIQWLDSDDLLAPDKIQLQLKEINFVQKTKTLLSSSFSKFYTDTTKSKFVPNILWQDLEPKYWLIKHLKDQAIMYPHAWLVSRNLTETAGEWNESLRLNQDGEYFCRVVAASDFVKFVQEAKCYYRIGNITSVSNKKSKGSLESLSLANTLCLDHLLKLENSPETRGAGLIFLQRFISKVYYEENEVETIRNIKNRIIELGGKVPSRNESWKFYLLRKIVGLHIARKLKTYLWNFEIIFRRRFHKIFSFILKN